MRVKTKKITFINENVRAVPKKEGILKRNEVLKFEQGKQETTYYHQIEFSKDDNREPMVQVIYKTLTRNNELDHLYKVPDGRRGNILLLNIEIPLSTALKLKDMLSTDPQFARELVEKLFLDQTHGIASTLKPNVEFSKTKTDTIGLGGLPPYEAPEWKKKNPIVDVNFDIPTPRT